MTTLHSKKPVVRRRYVSSLHRVARAVKLVEDGTLAVSAAANIAKAAPERQWPSRRQTGAGGDPRVVEANRQANEQTAGILGMMLEYERAMANAIDAGQANGLWGRNTMRPFEANAAPLRRASAPLARWCICAVLAKGTPTSAQ